MLLNRDILIQFAFRCNFDNQLFYENAFQGKQQQRKKTNPNKDVLITELLNKGLILIIGLAQRLIIKYYSLILLENLQNSSHRCGWLAELSIFQRALLAEFSVNLRCRYNIDTVSMTSRHHTKVASTSCLFCDSSCYLGNCSTYNSPLCLGNNNIKSVFDFVIIVVAVTPCPFIFSRTTGRQLAILFEFCVYNFLVEVIVY